MKFLIKKRNYIILFVIVLLVFWILFNLFIKKDIYIKSFDYFDEMITIKVYDKINQDKVTSDISNILKSYEEGKRNKELKEYGKIIYAKSDGYIDITNTELVKALRRGDSYSFTTKINDNDFENYNYSMVDDSYAVSDIIDYFKQNNINSYIINEDGNIIAGQGYDGKYKVSLNKYGSNKILDIVFLENKSLYTLNKSDEIEDYMVNPKTSEVSSNFDSVSVIADDNLTADMLARTLFLMNEDEGRKFIKNYDAEVLWQKDGKMIMSDGFKNYLEK